MDPEGDVEGVVFVLETRSDYEEAVAALGESIEAASQLSTSIARLADSIEVYEKAHDIVISYTE